jgi:hypothetical protein
MTQFDWQTGVALICVAAAIAVLARRVRAFFRGTKEPGCGSRCGGCATPPTLVNLGEQKGFVSLDSLAGRHSGPDFTHKIKSDSGRTAPTTVDEKSV